MEHGVSFLASKEKYNCDTLMNGIWMLALANRALHEGSGQKEITRPFKTYENGEKGLRVAAATAASTGEQVAAALLITETNFEMIATRTNDRERQPSARVQKAFRCKSAII